MNLIKTDSTHKSMIYHYNDYLVVTASSLRGVFFFVRGISLTGNVFSHFGGRNAEFRRITRDCKGTDKTVKTQVDALEKVKKSE